MIENILLLLPIFLIIASLNYAHDLQKPVIFVLQKLYFCEMMNEKSSIHTKILYNLGFSSYNIGITLLAIEYRIKYLSQTHTELVFWSLLASVFFLTLTMVIHGQDNKTNLKIHILFAIGWISMTTQAMVILSIIYYPSMILYIMTAFIFLGYLIKYSNVEDKNNKTKSVIASKIIILLQLVIIYFIFLLK